MRLKLFYAPRFRPMQANHPLGLTTCHLKGIGEGDEIQRAFAGELRFRELVPMFAPPRQPTILRGDIPKVDQKQAIGEPMNEFVRSLADDPSVGRGKSDAHQIGGETPTEFRHAVAGVQQSCGRWRPAMCRCGFLSPVGHPFERRR